MRRLHPLSIVGATVALCAGFSLALAQPQRRIRHKVPIQRKQVQQQAIQNIDTIQQLNGGAWQRTQLRIQPPVRARARGPLTARAIEQSIDDALLFLRNQQLPDGRIGPGYMAGGSTALAALAMLAAGASPSSDQSLNRALDFLENLETDNTYVRGIRANVWEYALRKAPHVERYRRLLKADFDWLLKIEPEGGPGWRYNSRSTDWDNSCTQYGVLGIWAGERAGFKAPDAFWARMSTHFQTHQNPDGGWGYVKGSSSSPNMATAGLASLFLVFDKHHAKHPFKRGQPNPYLKGEPAKVLAAIERGMGFLGDSQGNKADSYYMYGIERAAVAGGRRLIGGEDWFKNGAAVALSRQEPSGQFNLRRGPAVGTALATLFLVYGGAPVAFNKLQYGEGQGWNLNPRDLANLSRRLWGAYERPLNWQTVHIDDPAAQFEAPILFISGEAAPDFDEGDVETLRTYIRRGGTILAEPSDHAPAFEAAMVALAERLFPAETHPNARLRVLPDDHGIYTVLPWKAGKQRPRLRAVSDGSRAVFLLSDGYLAADWQTDAADAPAFDLAMNLLFYTTDRGRLEGRFATFVPQPLAKPASSPGPSLIPATPLKVARLMYGLGGGWDVARASWPAFLPYARARIGQPIEQAPAILPGAAIPEDVQVLHLTGVEAVQIEAESWAPVDAFLERGGILLVDSWSGSTAFADSIRLFLSGRTAGFEPLDLDAPLAAGRFEGGTDLSEGIRLKLGARRARRALGLSVKGPQIEVASVGAGLVVLSGLDLSAAMAGIEIFESKGYKPGSARRIVTNVLGLAAARRGG